MRRITEIDVGELLRYSENNTAQTYIRLFRDAGLYTTIGEDTEHAGVLLIWKLRDAVQLLQKAEISHQATRQPSIFALSSIVPIVWWYGIVLIIILCLTLGTVSGFLLFWYVAGGSAILGLCMALLKGIQRKTLERYRKIQCHALQKTIDTYIQEFSEINFCYTVGTHSLVIHQPQRKKMIVLLQESQKKRDQERIAKINQILQLYDQKIRTLTEEYEQGYCDLVFLMKEIGYDDIS